MAVDHRNDVHARVARPTEHLDDPAAWIAVPVQPLLQRHHDELPGHGGGVADDIHPTLDGLIIAVDPTEISGRLVNSDQFPGTALQHLLHLALHFLRGIRCELTASAERPCHCLDDGDRHPVAIQRGIHIPAVDENSRMQCEVDARSEILCVCEIREKERVAFRVEFQRSGELILRRGGEQVGRLFPHLNCAFCDECVERHFQLGDAGAGQFQATGDLGLRKRVAVCGAEGVEDEIAQVLTEHELSLRRRVRHRNGKGGRKGLLPAKCSSRYLLCECGRNCGIVSRLIFAFLSRL